MRRDKPSIRKNYAGTISCRSGVGNNGIVVRLQEAATNCPNHSEDASSHQQQAARLGRRRGAPVGSPLVPSTVQKEEINQRLAVAIQDVEHRIIATVNLPGFGGAAQSAQKS